TGLCLIFSKSIFRACPKTASSRSACAAQSPFPVQADSRSCKAASQMPAQSAARRPWQDFDTRLHLLAYLFDVRDDSDKTSAFLKLLQSRKRKIKGFRIKRSEAFIDENRIK